MTATATAAEKAKAKPKNRFTAWLLCVLWVAIAFNYSHIYVVYKSHGRSIMGTTPDDRPTLLKQQVKQQVDMQQQQQQQDEEDEEQLVKVHNKPPGDTFQHAKTRNRFPHDFNPEETGKKDDRFFQRQHHNHKRRFVEAHAQNATTEEHREQLIAQAKQIFVDLETDQVPNTHNQEDPWFVLHIGPPKTATTTIQCGLEKHSLRLAKTDGYHFLGGGCGNEGKTYYMPNGEAVVLRKKVMDALVIKNPEHESKTHLKDFVKRARKLRNKGRSVILSSELFGSRLPASSSIMNKLQKLIMHPKRAGFSKSKVKIVLAYRHFVDWLPSFHYQTYLQTSHADEPFSREDNHTRRGPPGVKPFLEYAEQYLSNWEHHQQLVAARNMTHTLDLDNSNMNMNANPTFENNDEEANEEEDADDDQDDEKGDTEEEKEDDLDLIFLPKDRRSIHPSWWLYQLWSYHYPLPNQVEVYDMHAPMNSNRPNDDMVTNFICNMLPGANHTCAKLLQMEDEREKQRQSNGTYVADTSINDSNEPNYDSLLLHTRGSFLHQKPEEKTKIKKGIGRQTVDHGENGISVRKSSDYDAVMIVEYLLRTGDIAFFDFENYGPEFFSQPRFKQELSKEGHKGYNKKELIAVAQELLDKHEIKAPDDRYYDCMSPDLEQRFLQASLTFVEMMYKKTEMLTQSSLASIQAGSNMTLEDEKEHRYQQALAEHARLFEKNKAKGKYCDINPEKVFAAFPQIAKRLSSLKFKPRYKAFRFQNIPPSCFPHLELLGIVRGNLSNPKFKRDMEWFLRLDPKEKAAAFHLGYPII